VSEEKITNHFKDCKPTIDKTYATLASAKSKLKGNGVLWRLVNSLSKRNWSLRKSLKFLRL
jgi:hypothetical protein